MRDWSTSNASRLRHGDISNVSNKARGIFFVWRRRSSSERLFRTFFLYLECCFTTGKSPVTVILKSSNLNVHEDSVIQWGTSVWTLVDEHCIFYWPTLVGKTCLWCAKNLCRANPKKCVPYLGHHKSQITNLRLRHTNTNEIWECFNEDCEKLSEAAAADLHAIVAMTCMSPKELDLTCLTIAFLTTRVRAPDTDDCWWSTWGAIMTNLLF